MMARMIRLSSFPLVPLVIAVLSSPVLAQDPSEAANAAEQVAERAAIAIVAIDPDEAAETYAGLPSLTPGAPEIVVEDAAGDERADLPELPPAPRGPAVRMIAEEVAQPLPVATPVSAPAPAPSRVASNDPFVIKSILPIEGTIRYGEWFWDESAAPRTGKLVITVDLEARVISAFRDGHEIGTAVALLGTQKHPTPLGTFPILTKEKDNVSEKYDNAPMPWTLRLTWDGIAIHGSPVMNGYASHGCIGVPDEFAAKLFAAAKRGDKVVITRGRMVGPGDKVL